MLTSRYLVVLEPENFRIRWSLLTADIMVPSLRAPNPIVEMNCMRVTLCDDELRILEFIDEERAHAA